MASEPREITLSDVKTAILKLSPNCTVEQVADTMQRVAWLKERASEYHKQLESLILEWIDYNGEFEIGDIRYYAGADKKIRCVDQHKTFNGLLEAAQGNFDAVLDCLASGALKPGACRKLLADKFDEHFTTETVVDLKEGKPIKKLQHVDKKYLK